MVKLPERVIVSEVCPRDGWQNHPVFIPTEIKIKYIKRMIDYGARNIEAASFVSPKAVPQMRDAAEVYEGIRDYAAEHGTEIMALTLNGKGVENARACGVEKVCFVLSASEEHNLRNSRRTIKASLEDFKNLASAAGDIKMMLAMPCVFGSPFGDDIPVERVIKLIREALSVGVTEIGLADTAGIANPYHTREVLQALKGEIDFKNVSIHLHDTRGMGLANAFAALEEGITKFDASLGALGGCPFVPGAKGNVGTEDLLNMFQSMGIETGYDLDAVVETAGEMGQEIDVGISSSMTSLCRH
ncbi:Hydroxymethylglutaryl-CoA lyase yngG [uncultured Roseburia sp.]|uniref:Hydroxymethylglutaryl-CoA lyase n=1 Tax=Brotonthovivens ammoniilytica TaxID=2981725 RepID=A0ABT2TKS7_9FIRM|nr:hydroxymethylglutaryl-CoA lyase [Brotonthovivens ammoniilytica]MCU6762702.1 hydroxymethylglutaryl-CoA lyase [Brotonthovivens ammoniilytica]SCI85360.1 Hydroxymethylglutaryl-CoA lyase yngG [uncultured Roseburia sp.]